MKTRKFKANYCNSAVKKGKVNLVLANYDEGNEMSIRLDKNQAIDIVTDLLNSVKHL